MPTTIETLNVIISNFLDCAKYPGETIRWVDGTQADSDYDVITLALTDNPAKVSLYKVEYEKRIYQPGKLVLTFNLPEDIDYAKLPSDLRVIFAGTIVNLYGAEDGTGNEVKLAEGYYVHSVSEKSERIPLPSSKGSGAGAFVTYSKLKQLQLVCYSPDYKLKVNNYCMTYTSKKFAAEIMSKEFEQSGIFAGKGITFNIQKLCHTTYNDNELIQPYLVQYNESFYDFITRVASRCGEFLYYENKQLNYGLPDDTKKMTPSSQKSFTESVLFGFPEISINFDTEGITQSKVGGYAYDYSKSEANTEGDFKYNQMVTNDDYLRRITEGDGPHYGDIMGPWEAVSCLGAGFAAESIEGFIKNMVDNAGTNFALAAIANNVAQDDFVTGYVKKDDKDKSSFVTLGVDMTKNLSNKFYRAVRLGSERASREKIVVDTESSLQNFKLGDALTCGSQQDYAGYVVTCMRGVLCNEIKQEYTGSGTTAVKYNTFSSINHYVEAVPAFKVGDGVCDIYPPESGIPAIRKAEPQVGIVTANDDPLRLGRVRVDFAWQHNKIAGVDYPNTMNEAVTSIQSTHSSPWVRVAVPFSGGMGGINMTLEKGEHVMLNFVGGNIELPYVEGALFTNDNTPDYGWVDLKSSYFLPTYKSRVISSASGHSISFIDGSKTSTFVSGLCGPVGQLWALITGATKFDEKIHNSEKKTKFYGDRPELMGGIVLRDSLGIYEIATSTQGRSITINSPIGRVDINAFTGITISAPNGDVTIKGKNVSIEAGNNVSIVSGKNIRGNKYKNEGAAAVGSLAGMIAKNIAVGASKEYFGFDPTKLTDLSFLRSSWEVIMRPVEGSLKLQSKRNVLMTAGKGNVNVPSSLLSHAKIMKKQKGMTTLPDWANDNLRKWEDVKDRFNIINRVIMSTFKLYEMSSKSVRSSYKKIKVLTLNGSSHYFAEGVAKDNKFILLDDYVRTLELPDYQTVDDLFKTNTTKAVMLSMPGLRDDVAVAEFVFETYRNIKLQHEEVIGRTISSRLQDLLRLNFRDDGWENFFDCINADLCGDSVVKLLVFEESLVANPEYKKIPVMVFRAVCYDILMRQSKTTGLYLKDVKDANDRPYTRDQIIYNDAAWQCMVKAITDKDPAADGTFKTGVKSAIAELAPILQSSYDPAEGVTFLPNPRKLVNYNGVDGPRSAWDAGHGGSILLSNNGGITYRLAEDGKSWQPSSNCQFEAVTNYLMNAGIDAQK